MLVVLVLLLTSCGSPEPEQADESAATAEVGEVEVPDVVGLDIPDALAEIRAVGLEPVTREVESEQPAGVVVRQSPAEGTLPEGDPVILEVADGSLDETDSGAQASGEEADAASGSDRETGPAPSSEAEQGESSMAASPSSIELRVVDKGFSWAPWGSDQAPAVSVSAVLENPTSHHGQRFQVTYTVSDDAGNARGSASEWISYAPAGATMHTAQRLYLDPGPPPASLEVFVAEVGVAHTAPPPTGAFSQLRFAQDDIFGEWQNPTSDVADGWHLVCSAYRGGQVIGGGWTRTDPVPPNGATAFRLGNGLVPGMQGDDIRCFSWDYSH